MQSNKSCSIIKQYLAYLVTVKGRSQNTISEYRLDLLRFIFYIADSRGYTQSNLSFADLVFIRSIRLGNKPLLSLIQTPANIASYARDYLVIIFVGLIATFFYNLNAAVLRAVGNTNAALIILAISVAVNFVLDLLFVSVFSWGIKGAAIATIISQLLSVICGTLYILIKIPALMFRRDNMRYDRELMQKTITYGAISALHQSSLYIGKLLVQGAVNSSGIDSISAYTASTRIEGFANSFGDSGAAATSIFIAQNEGADNKKRVKEGIQTSMIMMALLGATLSIIMAYSTADAG